MIKLKQKQKLRQNLSLSFSLLLRGQEGPIWRISCMCQVNHFDTGLYCLNVITLAVSNLKLEHGKEQQSQEDQ